MCRHARQTRGGADLPAQTELTKPQPGRGTMHNPLPKECARSSVSVLDYGNRRPRPHVQAKPGTHRQVGTRNASPAKPTGWSRTESIPTANTCSAIIRAKPEHLSVEEPSKNPGTTPDNHQTSIHRKGQSLLSSHPQTQQHRHPAPHPPATNSARSDVQARPHNIFNNSSGRRGHTHPSSRNPAPFPHPTFPESQHP